MIGGQPNAALYNKDYSRWGRKWQHGKREERLPPTDAPPHKRDKYERVQTLTKINNAPWSPWADAVGVTQVQGTGGIGGHELVGVADLIVAQHMAGIQTHEYRVAHVAVAEGVPRIEDVIVAEGYIDALCGQLLDAGHAAALGIGIGTAAQMNVDAGIGNKVHAAHLQDTHEANDIGIVVAVHCGGVGGSDHIAHTGLVGTGGNGLQTAGSLVIDLVAVDIDELVILLSQLEADVEGLNGILTGELEVRDCTGSVGAHLQGVFQQLFALGIAEDTVLREGNDLDIRPLLDEAFFIHQSMNIDELLPVMSKRKLNMAVVTDNYGGTLGIVTVEDILEELVGEIWDEEDVVEEPVVELPDGSYQVDADQSVSDVFELFGFEDPEENEELINTLMGEWAYEQFAAIPKTGESFEYHGLRVTVTEMEHNRILKLNVSLAPQAKEGGEQ